MNEALGQGLRKLRTTHRLSLATIQGGLRSRGFQTPISSLSELERGHLNFSIPLLIGYLDVVGDLTDDRMKLSEVVTAESVMLSEHMSVSGQAVSQFLEGAVVELTPWNTELESIPTKRPFEIEAVQSAVDQLPDGMTLERLDELGKLLSEASLAEQRTAKRLGIHPTALQIWARTLWGHSLEEEAAAQAGPDASAQKRGHVTRLLTDEVRKRLEWKTAHPPEKQEATREDDGSITIRKAKPGKPYLSDG